MCAPVCVMQREREREGAQPSADLPSRSGFRRENDADCAAHLHMGRDRLQRRSRRIDAVDRAENKLWRSLPSPRHGFTKSRFLGAHLRNTNSVSHEMATSHGLL